MNDDHMMVRERCALAICKLGKRGEVRSSLLLEAFRRDDFAVQMSVVKAMGLLVPRGEEEVVSCLMGGLEDEENGVNMLLEVMQALMKVSRGCIDVSSERWDLKT